MQLAVRCHVLTRALPRRGSSGLASQIERAAGSVPANIAEGCGRRTRADYLRHLSIASGSLLELETHVLLAGEIGVTSPQRVAEVMQLASEVGRMLMGLIRVLEQRDDTRSS